MKKILILILLLFVFSSFYGQNPPDQPLSPKEWISHMGNGLWWIFKIPPRHDNNILIDNYDASILDTMQQKLCINGGRLHFSAGGDNNSMFISGTHQLYQEAIDSLELIIDDMIARNMAICLMVDFQPSDHIMTEDIKQRYYDAWAQICEAYKDKSHLLAMSPVIEFHGWKTLSSHDRRDSLNVFYDTLAVIFRQYNPTRIMSFKPWGAARRAEFYTLDFPFGNDPAPDDPIQPIYYMASFSGGYGLGEWWKWSENMDPDTLQMIKNQTMNAGGNNTHIWGINAAIEYRNQTGIQFWCDHWSPNFFKHVNDTYPNRWTIEQNIAYINFFRDTLIAIGSCGAGIQLNKFWDDQTRDLIRQTLNTDDSEEMSLALIKQYKQDCQVLSINKNNTENNYILYPNPVSDKLVIETNSSFCKNISIYDLSGKDFTPLIKTNYENKNKIILNVKKIPRGFYILRINNQSFKIIVV